MKIYKSVIGSYATNCYLLVDEDSGEAAAVDCAVFDGDYRRMLETAGIKELKYILLTHGHFDHICGVKQLKDAFGGEICVSEGDSACLSDEAESLNEYVRYSVQQLCKPDIILHEGDILRLGKTAIKVLETPGHTKGGLCFLTDDSLFSGDTMFRLSIGRIDLPGGSLLQLFASLRRIGALSGDLTIYPGHGENTDLDFEQRNSRHLRSEKYRSVR